MPHLLYSYPNFYTKFKQLERDKQEVEEKLNEIQTGDDDIERAERMKTLEKELSVAKDVCI